MRQLPLWPPTLDGTENTKDFASIYIYLYYESSKWHLYTVNFLHAMTGGGTHFKTHLFRVGQRT